jgi:hypothetical protein
MGTSALGLVVKIALVAVDALVVAVEALLALLPRSLVVSERILLRSNRRSLSVGIAHEICVSSW